MKKLITTLLSLFAYAYSFAALATWTGPATGNWDEATHWSIGTVPGYQDVVFLSGNKTIHIPSGFAAGLSRLVVNNGATLIIDAGATLDVEGCQSVGAVENSSTLENYGTITIQNAQFYGILNKNGGQFTNKPGASITVSSHIRQMLGNEGASTVFINEGLINLMDSQISLGIENKTGANFQNKATGIINIHNTAAKGMTIKDAGSHFSNEGLINIHTGISQQAINIEEASFNNLAGGEINITGTNKGITIYHSISGFTNNGTLHIFNLDSGTAIDIWDSAFTNDLTGAIYLDTIPDVAISNYGQYLSNTLFTNHGLIHLGAGIDGIAIYNKAEATFLNESNGNIICKTKTMLYNQHEYTTFVNSGLMDIYPTLSSGASITNRDKAHFENTPGGIINMRHVNTGISNLNSGTLFRNSGQIMMLMNVANMGLSNSNEAAFINTSTGSIFINDAMQFGIHNSGTGTHFSNEGFISIDRVLTWDGIMNISGAFFSNKETGNISINHVAYEGIENTNSEATFENEGTIQMEEGIYGNGIGNRTDGLFNNKPTGIIEINGTNQNALLNYGGVFTNEGIFRTTNNIAKNAIHNFNGGTFTNAESGVLDLNKAGEQGIHNNLPQGNFPNTNFYNEGTIHIKGCQLHDILNGYGAVFINQEEATVNLYKVLAGGAAISNIGLDGSFVTYFVNEGFVNFLSSAGALMVDGLGTGRFDNTVLGTVTGNGLIDGRFFINFGTLAPGINLGTLNIDYDYDHSKGTYDAEIAGSSQSSPTAGYDRVHITGNVLLGGTLKVSLINGYEPVVGDHFDLLTWTGNSTGDFDVINLPPLENGEWEVSIGSNYYRLSILAPLPVELIDFSAKPAGSAIKLNWTTASEINNLGFDIERSADTRQWEKIAFVPGQGTSTATNQYNYTDERPIAGTNYYRLRQVDLDGQFDYSNIQAVDLGTTRPVLRIFPNPSTEYLSLTGVAENENCHVVIRNANGQIVFEGQVTDSSMNVNVQSWAAGIYYLSCQGIGWREDFRFVVQ